MSITRQFTIINNSSVSHEITSAVISPPAPEFTLQASASLPNPLGPGESMSIDVTAISETEGLVTSGLVIEHTDTGSPITVPLSANFIAPVEPDISFVIEFYLGGEWVEAFYDTTTDLGESPASTPEVVIQTRVRNTGSIAQLFTLNFSGTNFSWTINNPSYVPVAAGDYYEFATTFTNPAIDTPDSYNDGIISADNMDTSKLTYLRYVTT